MSLLWRNVFGQKTGDDSLAGFLSSVPLFADLKPRDVRQLAALVHPRDYDDKETVFSEGDPGSGLYLIRNGRVKVFTRDSDGREHEIAVLEAGDFFGETTLVSPAVRTASVRTLEKTQLVGFFRADLLDCMEKNPRLALKLLFGLTRAMSERLHLADRELKRLHHALHDLQAEEQD